MRVNNVRWVSTRIVQDCFKARDTCVRVRQASVRTLQRSAKLKAASVIVRQASTRIFQDSVNVSNMFKTNFYKESAWLCQGESHVCLLDRLV